MSREGETADYEDVTASSADIMKAINSHGAAYVSRRLRPLRGRAVVELLGETPSILHMPDADPRDVKWHRGKVLALGKPAFVGGKSTSPEMPWGCQVGDEVIFHLFLWLDAMRTLVYPGAKGKCMVVGQVEVQAVIERG
jgi:hypothetical protein